MVKNKEKYLIYFYGWFVTSYSIILQSCRDDFLSSWVKIIIKQWVKCLAQVRNTVAPVSLELATIPNPQSNALPTEPFCSPTRRLFWASKMLNLTDKISLNRFVFQISDSFFSRYGNK